jgi:peptidoglycan/LPS O-acetylase OafA/YrhL
MSEQERLATAARSPDDLAGFVPLYRPIRTGPDPGTGSFGLATASLPVRGGEIIALTSLRGIAAIAVVMQHFSATAQLHCLVPMPSLVPHGYLAVDLFFVLSGFIMSYTYLNSFQRNGMRAFGDFILRRVARIVPLNIVVLLILVTAGAISTLMLGRNIIYQSDHLPTDLLANLLMLQGLGVGRNLNGPSWSISTEFAAYLIFPGLVVIVFSGRRMVCTATLVVCLAALCLLASLHPRLGLNTDRIGQNLLRCFVEFTIGMISYRLFTVSRCADVLGRDAVAFGLMALCLLFVGLRLDLPTALLFPLLIVALAVNRGRSARLMSHPVFYFLGVVSFSIYLIHQVFRDVELEILRSLHPALVDAPAALTLALAGSLSVVPFAWLTYRYVERPGRTFVRETFALS